MIFYLVVVFVFVVFVLFCFVGSACRKTLAFAFSLFDSADTFAAIFIFFCWVCSARKPSLPPSPPLCNPRLRSLLCPGQRNGGLEISVLWGCFLCTR